MKRNTRMTLAGAALAVGLIVTGPHSRVLAAGTVTVNFAGAEMVDVLKALATQTGSNIVAGPEVNGKQISVSLKNVELKTALDMVTRLNGLAYQEMGGTYVVATPTHLKEMYPGASETSIYTLTSLKPADAVTTLTKMVPSLLAQAQGTSMVTLTGSADEVQQGRQLLARMEGASNSTQGERQTEVYDLKFLNVLEATRTLAGLVPDVLVTPGPGKRLPGEGKTGSNSNATTEVTLANEKIESSGAVLTPGAAIADTKITFTPGEEPNTLLLTGYPAALEKARNLLAKMDIAPRQVEITARVVDLNNNDAQKLGLKYTPRPLDVTEKGDITGTAAGRLLSFGQFARLPFDVAIDPDYQAILKNSRLLANPKVAAVDGRPARIFIGDTITYVISQNLDPKTGILTYQTEKAHVGITLLTVPKISPTGEITLEVHPTVSALVALDTFGNVTLPRISERSVDTTVRVKDGETIAIGGLMREDEIKTMTSIPILSKIPILGELFKHRDTAKTKSDVTLFITTRIVPDN
jgi:general secretion pathway protein D